MDAKLNSVLDRFNDSRHLASMKPSEWARFLSPVLPKDDGTGTLIKAMIVNGELSTQKIVDLERIYLHLVREKVIQGNIFDVGFDTHVYRTMKCSDFHESFKSGTLFLVNPSQWAGLGDAWENTILSGEVYSFDPNDPNHTVVQRTEQIRDELKKWYAQSWSLTPECDAFWNRYTANGTRAVQISTTVGKLMLSIFDDKTSYATTFMSRIRYLSESEIDESKVIASPFEIEKSIRNLLNLKRAAYSYENEVRLMYFDRDGENNGGRSITIPVHGGLSSFIESIIFDPKCPQDCLDAENSFLHEHGYGADATISKLGTPSLKPTVLVVNNLC